MLVATDASELGRVGIDNDKLTSIKSQDPSIMWSCKVMWKIRFVIYLLTQDLWPPNLAKRLLTLRIFQTENHATFESIRSSLP